VSVQSINRLLWYALDGVEVVDPRRGTKLTLDCDAPSGKMNFSRNSVFVRPLAAAQTFVINSDLTAVAAGGFAAELHAGRRHRSIIAAALRALCFRRQRLTAKCG